MQILHFYIWILCILPMRYSEQVPIVINIISNRPIWSRDETLPGVTTSGLSGPWSNSSEEWT